MSYNISYSTLPTFTSNSIGYVYSDSLYWYANYSSWMAPVTPITLTPGVYYITSNIAYQNSPNVYAYIILNNNSNQSVFFDSHNTYYSMNSFSNFQGSNPDSTSSVFGLYENWYPVACQQMRNGANGSSAALSLSAVVTIYSNTQVNTLAYIQSTNQQACITLKCVRIS